jgi:hypothetical protein
MGGATGSVLTGVGAIFLGALSWVALNFFGTPISTLREKRRKALEVGERCAYVGLDLVIGDDALGLLRSPPSDDQKRAFSELHGAGNSLRAHFRALSLAIRIYCRVREVLIGLPACLSLSCGVAARAGLSARLCGIVAPDDIPVTRRVMVRGEPEHGFERDVPVEAPIVRMRGQPLAIAKTGGELARTALMIMFGAAGLVIGSAAVDRPMPTAQNILRPRTLRLAASTARS